MIPVRAPSSAWFNLYGSLDQFYNHHLPAVLRPGARRLWNARITLLQMGLAAMVAYWVARDLVGHEQPFFAPMAALISMGVGRDRRIRRSFELVLGNAVGIGIGDLLIGQIGSGPWQIGLVVIVAVSIAVFADKGALIVPQAGSAAVLVATLLPPGDAAGFDRVIDALIGGLIGIVLMALLPYNPVKTVRREIATVVNFTAQTLDQLSAALRAQDLAQVRVEREKIRTTQAAINEMLAIAGGAEETAAISPLYWSAKRHIRTLTRIVLPVDNAVRSTRVLCRRAEIALEDHTVVDPAFADIVAELGRCTHTVRDMIMGEVTGGRPTPLDAAAELRAVAASLRPEMIEDYGVSEIVMFAQLRSVVVDLLQVCGLSRDSARAALPPLVDDPYMPPEVWGPEQH